MWLNRKIITNLHATSHTPRRSRQSIPIRSRTTIRTFWFFSCCVTPRGGVKQPRWHVTSDSLWNVETFSLLKVRPWDLTKQEKQLTICQGRNDLTRPDCVYTRIKAIVPLAWRCWFRACGDIVGDCPEHPI